MEKQSLKRGRKKKNRNQKQNHDAELFVLSPNLLEQLGIELGQTTRKNESIGTEMEECMNNNTAVDNMSNSPNLNKDTSLSETATLTKNSIFLSPTFTHYAEASSNDSISENVKNKVAAIDDAIHRNSLQIEPESNTFEKEVVPSKMTNGNSTRSKIHIISQEAIVPPYKLCPRTLINPEDIKNTIDSNQKTTLISTYAPEILVDKINVSGNVMMEWENNSSISGSDSRNDHHTQRCLESDIKFACAVQVTNVNNIYQSEGNYYCNELSYPESVNFGPNKQLNQEMLSEKPETSFLNQVTSHQPKENLVNLKATYPQEIARSEAAQCTDNPVANNNIIAEQLKNIPVFENFAVNNLAAAQSKENPVVNSYEVQSKEKPILSELNEVQSTEKPILSELKAVQSKEKLTLSEFNEVISKEKHILSDLNPVQSKEKIIFSELNEIHSQENPILSELNAVKCKGKRILSKIYEVQSTEKPKLSEINAVQSKEKLMLSELNAVKSKGKPILSKIYEVQPPEKPKLSQINAVQSKGKHILSKIHEVQSIEKPKWIQINAVQSKGHCVLNDVQTVQSKDKLVAHDTKVVNSEDLFSEKIENKHQDLLSEKIEKKHQDLLSEKIENKHEDLLSNKLERKHEDLSNKITCRTDSRTNIDILDSETQNHNVEFVSSIEPSIFPNSKQNIVENRLCDITVTQEDQRSLAVSDSVKEIASYLSKVMKKKQLSNVKNNVIPKSSFHGVEKPGGVQELNKSTHRIYKRKNHHAHKKNAQQFEITYKDQLDKIINSNHVIDCEKAIISTTSQETFCNCSDFGNISYDSEMICSEHVHFENKKTNIKLENIFDFDDRLTIDNVWEQVVNHETYCSSSSESEDNNLPNFICFLSEQFETTLETGHCDITIVPEKSHKIDLKNVMNENQTKREFPKKTISKTASDNTSFEEYTLGNEKENQSSVASTSDAIKINKDKSEIPLNKNKVKRNNSNVEVNVLTGEKRHSRAEKVSTTKEDQITDVEIVNSAAIAESKSVSESNGMKNDSLSFVKKESVKRESTQKEKESPKKSTVVIGNERNKSNSDVVTRMDALSSKKRKICSEVEKHDTVNLKPHNFVGEPCLKKHKSDKIYKNRKRLELPTEQFYKCDDCNELINDQTRAMHVEDHHSFIGFNENSKELTNSKKIRDSEQVSSTQEKCDLEKVSSSKNENNTKKNSYSEKVRYLGKEVGDKDNAASDLVKSSVICGVCNESVPFDEWRKHIAQVHNYLAWKKNKRPLDMDNNEAVRQYLHEVCKETGALVCCKCGKIRKYAKSFMQHIKNCTGPEDTSTLSIDASVKESVIEAEYTSVSERLKDSAQEKNISSMSIDQSTKESFCTDVNTSKSTAFCDENKHLKCGVCMKEVVQSQWIDHIFTEHDYIAWKEGDKPLDINNEQSIHIHLHNTAKDIGGLTCSKCGMLRKYAKKYMQHIKKCTGPKMQDTMDMDESVNESIVKAENTSVSKDLKCSTQEQNIKSTSKDQSTNDSFISKIDTIESVPACDENEAVKCGACMEEVVKSRWIDHIFTEHDYIAWKEGDKTLDLNDEQSIYLHLHNTAKDRGGLTCSKCGTLRKSAKKYMQHIKKCTGLEDTMYVDESVNESIVKAEETSNSKDLKNSTQSISSISKDQSTYDNLISKIDATESTPACDENEAVMCGVCMKEVVKSKWIDHIFTEHDYIAWKEGDKPLNLNDEQSIRSHLHNTAKEIGQLTCSKCGTLRKYVKSYMAHVKYCSGEKDISSMSLDISVTEADLRVKDEMNKDSIPDLEENMNLKCGVCEEEVEKSSWWNHIFKNHQYLARLAGEPPINLEDAGEVRLHLHRISKQLHGLKCPKCGRKIKYAKNYIEHVKTCDETGIKSEDEISLCDESQNYFREQRSIVRERATKNTMADNANYKCGVCGKAVDASNWISHISNQHQYIAWKEGEPPLDLDDDEEIRLHLHDISKQLNGLKCKKCGRRIKYAKIFMEHVNSCGETTKNSEDEISLLEESQRLKESCSLNSDETAYKCGVCGKEVVSNHWMQHIFREHQYFAWKEGDTPLNLEDDEEMRLHLHGISKQLQGLMCTKCGRKIKYAKNYMEHVKSCDASSTNSEDEISLYAESLKLRKSRILATDTVFEEKSQDNIVYRCGRCAKEVDSCDWMSHIFKEHQYIAWKEGEKPLNLDNDEEVRLYLHGLCKQINGLECFKCWRIFRYAKVYVEHVKHCAESGQASENTSSMSKESPKKEGSPRIKTEKITEGTVTCAVCHEEVDSLNWISHICAKHQYIAWKKGDKPLNLNDEDEMRQHLHDISRENNGLICCNCDRKIKYAKNYMDHIKNCADSVPNNLWRSSELKSYFELDETQVDCGVCDMTVKVEQWLDHIQKKHNYLAKKKGAKPLDIENQDEVLYHLNVILKALGNLTCVDCGVVRKYSKVFLHHLKCCDKSKSFPESLAESGEKAVCAMCSQEVSPQMWKKHVMEEHYNVGWMVGQQPLNINSQALVNSKLKEYKDAGHQLLCKVCGLLRISEQGFFAHIMVCGRSEVEQEVFNVVCEICNEKYLYLYKYKHMKIHKDEKILQEKLQKAEKTCDIDDNGSDTQDSGKRRAKKKAIKVIGNLTKNISGYKFKCQKCDFGSDFIKELNSHNCDENQNVFESDGDDSVKSEALSDNESPESDIDSNVSAEEEAQDLSNDDDDDEDDGMGEGNHAETRKRKRALPPDSDMLFPLGPKKPPMNIKDRKLFIVQSGKDYIDAYYSDDLLYPEWRKSINEILPQEKASIYFPSLEESCQLNIDNNKIFLKRFEAVMRPGAVLFAGGCVRRLAFAPTRLDEPKPVSGNFLAILCHRGTEEPRYVDDQIVQGPGLVQIWDFNNFTTVPTFELGLCHDFGTIWACDWCPSGCRDYLQQDAEDDQEARLGLLAIACSNGSAYILSVPYPSTVVKDENKFLRINPVAELRMSEPSTRKIYQATAIKWTPQNGHETIAVGYSSGYVAYYNLKQNSPLLGHKENGVDIYYPYQEERRHKSCVTDIDIGALMESTSDISIVSSASPSGSCLTAQSAGGFSARCVGINPADKAFLSRVCPHVLLAGDYSAVNKCINEIEWWGSYQRRLAIQTCAECLKCGALASYTSPVIKLLKLYPLLDHKNTKMPLKVVDLVPLGAKRKIQSDKLGLVVEPRTYEEAIKKYGVGVFRVTNKRAVSESQRSVSIDRFPLADVTSMDFCTASIHHHKLAVAIHAGFVFITHAC